jgi:hypothetical protein
MRRIKPFKSKRVLEDLLMRRFATESTCSGITKVVVKRLERPNLDAPNWQASYFRHGGFTPAALMAADEIARVASTEFDLDE